MGITSYCENTGRIKVTELLPGFMAGWRDRKKQEDKKGNNFYTREDYWNSDKLKLQNIDIVNLYNGKLC